MHALANRASGRDAAFDRRKLQRANPPRKTRARSATLSGSTTALRERRTRGGRGGSAQGPSTISSEARKGKSLVARKVENGCVEMELNVGRAERLGWRTVAQRARAGIQ